MTADRRPREARQVGIGNRRDRLDFLDEGAEAGAEDQGDLWLKARGRTLENVAHG